MSVKQISLYYSEGSSDKEYHAQIVGDEGGFTVDFQYGRRGSTLTAGTKTQMPVTLAEAEKIFAKLIKEKKSKGYTEGEAGTPYVGGEKEERRTEYLPQLLNPIADLKHIINDNNWCAQEKYDGKRMLLRQVNGSVIAINRSGLECGAPEDVLNDLNSYTETVIDGECIGDEFYAFDCLVKHGEDLRSEPYLDRYAALLELLPDSSYILVSPIVTRFKQKFVDSLRSAGKEGAVFKRLDAPYKAGRPNSGGSQFKYKFVESATCVVHKLNTKRSVGIGVVLQGEEDFIDVGNVTIPPNYDIPKVGDLAEVEYLYAYRGGSLYQPVYKGVRDDKTEADSSESLKYKEVKAA
jgi:bifunctional non-homologous end joining protein LigD